MAIRVRRSGVTSRYWQPGFHDAKLKVLLEEQIVTTNFHMNSKGGGQTQVEVQMDCDSFDEMARAMMLANPLKAITAFGNALASAKLAIKDRAKA